MPKTGEVDLQKLKYWKAVMSDFQKSGLSGKEYCRRRGISYSGFAERRRELAASTLPGRQRSGTSAAARPREVQASHNSSEFAELTFKEPDVASSKSCAERLEVVFLSGTVLRVPSGYSSHELVKIIAALECK